MTEIKTVGIYIFDQIELLDFTGPLQVFSAARHLDDTLIPVIEIVGNKEEITVAKSGLKVKTNRFLGDVGGYDLFIIPGGFGTREIIKNREELKALKQICDHSVLVASVCTGSLVLAKLGYLSGLTATTHFGAVELLQTLEPNVILDRSKRFHDNGKFIVSEGVSAGIDMSFYLLAKYFSQEISDTVKKYIEYFPEKS